MTYMKTRFEFYDGDDADKWAGEAAWHELLKYDGDCGHLFWER